MIARICPVIILIMFLIGELALMPFTGPWGQVLVLAYVAVWSGRGGSLWVAIAGAVIEDFIAHGVVGGVLIWFVPLLFGARWLRRHVVTGSVMPDICLIVGAIIGVIAEKMIILGPVFSLTSIFVLIFGILGIGLIARIIGYTTGMLGNRS